MAIPEFLRRFERELRRGVLPLWLLDELASVGPTYGYRLIARVSSRAGPGLRIGPSTVYPALARLRAAGLVESYHGRESLGPIRKYYRLTPEGRRARLEARSLVTRYRAGAPGPAAPTGFGTRSGAAA